MRGGRGAALRSALVRELRSNGVVRSAAVEAAFAAVPRERFTPPGTSLEETYADRALVLTRDADGQPTSTISQPSMVALMLEQLRLQPGHRVLEIGTASGYNAAILHHLIAPTGTVTTVELDAELAATARHRLAGLEPPVLVCAGDGWLGAPEQAPFDRVQVTVGVDDLAPVWVTQLRDGGVLVVPVTLRPGLELSLALVRSGGELQSASVHPCGFVRLRGPHAQPDGRLAVGNGATLLADLPPGSEEAVRALLVAGPQDAGAAGRTPDGWAVQVALDAAHPLVLTTADPKPAVCLGVYDPAGGGIAVVDGDRIASYGEAGAARLLREHLEVAVPLRAGALRVVVRPPDAPPPPGRWTIRARHAVFGVDRSP